MTEHNMRSRGQTFEALACKHLKAQGLTLVEKNYEWPGVGEIDLIMKADHESYVFVEVRYRQSNDYGESAATISKTKQRRIIKTAQHYLQKHELTNKVYCRFDVVAFETDNNELTLDWIPAAFDAVH